jgi:hypothetical protein
MIKCVLDEDGCIDLQAVMRIMNQVDQEQVWAIAYELAALMQRLWPAGNCDLIDSLAQIHIHQDGFIHEKSLLRAASKPPPSDGKPKLQDTSNQLQHEARLETNTTTTATTTTTNTNTTITTSQADISDAEKSTRVAETNKTIQQQQLPPSPPITPELNESATTRRPALSESELVASLGIALFWTLDYGIPDDEERKLSMTMEYLIFKSQSELTLNEVLEICIKRLPVATKTNADRHYREICKSLISDTIELSIFLEKIYTATMELGGIDVPTRRDTSCCNKEFCDSCLALNNLELGLPLASLRALKIDDWARLWMQVIREMRQRSEFKHLGMTTIASHELGCSSSAR